MSARGNFLCGQNARGETSSSSCETCSVRSLAICSPLKDTELNHMCEILTKTHISQGEVLFYEQDRAEHVYNVTAGCIKLYKSLPDGRTQITAFLLPGDFIGFELRGVHGCSAEAVTDTSLCRFEAESLKEFMDQNNALEKRLIDIMRHEILVAQEQMLLLGRKTSGEKLTSFLLSLLDRFKRINGNQGDLLNLPMTRTDIADYLGLTTESVSRSFSKLRNQGVISTPNNHTVMFLDLAKLQKMSGE